MIKSFLRSDFNPLRIDKIFNGQAEIIDWFGFVIVLILALGILYFFRKAWVSLVNIRASNKKEGDLYREFESQLVEVRPSFNEDPIRHRVGSASEIFNRKSLGAGLIGNPLLIAIPAVLTGVGVLGTFWGLQDGIGSLKFTNNDPVVKKHSANNLIPVDFDWRNELDLKFDLNA
ncbi:hypothetical protein OAK16_04675, partial [Verrucomicrobia bacterium]|nr:hypothetical protein [Verrucomicrobiota bacterium]